MTHLTEEDFGNLLLDIPCEPRVLAHLHACEQCRSEIASFRSATKDFNEYGERWASHDAVRSVQHPMRLAAKLGMRPRVALRWTGAAAAATLLATIALHEVHPGQRARSPYTAGPSAAQVTEDNQWLLAMNHDLQAGPDGLAIVLDKPRQAPHHRHPHMPVNRKASE